MAAAETFPAPGVPDRRPVRWYNSLFFRVIVLCCVLLLCLLGAVTVITVYYFQEVVQEMEAQTTEIAQSIVLSFRENSAVDMEEIRDLHKGIDFDFLLPEVLPDTTEITTDSTIGEPSLTLERHPDGSIMRVATVPIILGNSKGVLKAEVKIVPQVEIVRAFKNKYIIAITSVFVLTISLMVYFIAKSLRPLSELSATCAEISSGNLKEVRTRQAAGEILALEQTFNQMVKSLREKELVETKLRQAQRLSALGNLAAGVAHDIRNPLNAIKLLSSHALDTLEPDSPASRPLNTIRHEVDRLEEIVSSFLSLAKERELAPEPVRVDSLLAECVRLFTKDAEARGVRLSSELRAGDTMLQLDPKQFTRAVLNVLLNALEACPAGGRVRLFSRIVDTACQIEIRDDGPGLPREVAEQVFDPYYTTKPGGTGLGLSITRSIVEEHGGTVDLTSIEGAGCQVLIALPMHS